MAVFFSWNCHRQSPDICFLLFSLLMTIFLFPTTLRASATQISFNFSSFDSNHPEIYTEKDASVSIEGIELTLNLGDMDQSKRVGRATYIKPLHLWDEASGNLTNFTTRFSFIINSKGDFNYGDGLAFFLAPNGSRLPPDVKAGGGLGLVVNDNAAQALNYSRNGFVAVEFDTYRNSWDPPFDHVGINVRSMESIVVAHWKSYIIEGNQTYASISYDSSRKILSISYTYVDISSYSIVQRNISAMVDLAEHLPEWVTFGFSASTGLSYEINRITLWEFDSSSDIVEAETLPSDAAGTSNTEPAASPIQSRSRRKTGLVVELSIGAGACAFLVCLGFLLYRLWRKPWKKLKTDDPVVDVFFSNHFKNGTGPRKFSYDELADATNNFSEKEKLGEGGFGAVYRGFLKDLNCYVAVKKISQGSKQGIKEYTTEVKIISRMRHRNLVKLIGWCHEKELLLAYEFMPNGSLDSHLFKGKSLLTRKMRYKIAEGLAYALLYLHEEGDQCVLHRDIKSSNIMLDSSFEAKLGDFGLARLVDHVKGSQTTVVAGTMGYMAPECFTCGKASKESDIYSFGVVALEIACGRRVVEPGLEEKQTRIVEWVWELHGKGKLLEAADSKLRGDFDKKEMERLMIVGLWCVHPDRTSRPSVRRLTNDLRDSEALLPMLPPQMPEPDYLAPLPKLSMSFLNQTGGSANSERKSIQILGYNYITNDSLKHTSSSGASSPSATLLLNTR